MKRCKLHSHAPFLLTVSLNILTCLCFPWHQMGPVGLFKEVGELCISNLLPLSLLQYLDLFYSFEVKEVEEEQKAFAAFLKNRKQLLQDATEPHTFWGKLFSKLHQALSSESFIREKLNTFTTIIWHLEIDKSFNFFQKNSLQLDFSVLILNCVYPQASVWLNAAKS